MPERLNIITWTTCYEQNNVFQLKTLIKKKKNSPDTEIGKTLVKYLWIIISVVICCVSF